MAALPLPTGCYSPARRLYGQWIVNWLQQQWTSPRRALADQLSRIRQADDSGEAIRFRNHLLWLGVYPH